MRLLFVIISFVLLSNCSFDNKTGIWKNENEISGKKENDKIFKDFKKIADFEKDFQKTINLSKDFKIKKSKVVINTQWNDIFYDYNNNFKNFSYNNLNQVLFRSKKLSKKKINYFKLFENNNLILNDEKGNIIVFSVIENIKIDEFNFYKKKFKKIDKKLNMIVENNVIYVSDNLGYLYAYNYNKQKILWAKNYKIPFSSNLKIFNNKLIASNQNNNLYFLNKHNGELINQFPTEETPVKNNFINNLSISKNEKLLFLNSYGTLYSIDIKMMKIDWFVYLNNSTDLSTSNLFDGSQVINKDNKIVVSSKSKTFIIDSLSGRIWNKFNYSSLSKPIIYNDIVFFYTKNNFLIAVNLKNNQIIYSYDMKKYIQKINKKNSNLKYSLQMMILNNEIFLFINNSFILNIDLNGKFRSLNRLKLKTNTFPISIENALYYLDKKNKLIILN